MWDADSAWVRLGSVIPWGSEWRVGVVDDALRARNIDHGLINAGSEAERKWMGLLLVPM